MVGDWGFYGCKTGWIGAVAFLVCNILRIELKTARACIPGGRWRLVACKLCPGGSASTRHIARLTILERDPLKPNQQTRSRVLFSRSSLSVQSKPIERMMI